MSESPQLARQGGSALSVPALLLPCVADFETDGSGRAAAWQAAAWVPLSRVGGTLPYGTRFKAVCSATGLYFLVDCEDRKLTCSLTEDYANLFTEDVVEIFLQPDPAIPLYIEYEISPLGYELVILVPNHKGSFYGWRPWNAPPGKAVRKAVTVTGGAQAAGAPVARWQAEVFLPFAVFCGLTDTRLVPGRAWHGNVYRIDYDQGATTHWAWSAATGSNFHDYGGFGRLQFGQ